MRAARSNRALFSRVRDPSPWPSRRRRRLRVDASARCAPGAACVLWRPTLARLAYGGGSGRFSTTSQSLEGEGGHAMGGFNENGINDRAVWARGGRGKRRRDKNDSQFVLRRTRARSSSFAIAYRITLQPVHRRSIHRSQRQRQRQRAQLQKRWRTSRTGLRDRC